MSRLCFLNDAKSTDKKKTFFPRSKHFQIMFGIDFDMVLSSIKYTFISYQIRTFAHTLAQRNKIKIMLQKLRFVNTSPNSKRKMTSIPNEE